MSKHTKGKLDYFANVTGLENHAGFTVHDEDQGHIAGFSSRDEDGIEGEANVCLFIQAPAMRALLERCDKILSRPLESTRPNFASQKDTAQLHVDIKTLLERSEKNI